jgi:hypothetical protein
VALAACALAYQATHRPRGPALAPRRPNLSARCLMVCASIRRSLLLHGCRCRMPSSMRA